MDKLIETYRRRIIKAAINRHIRKTGGSCIVISQPRGEIKTLELTEILLDGLLCRFEKQAVSEFGNIEGVKAVRGIYNSAVYVNGRGEFLTESGKELIDDLIKELVDFAKKHKPAVAEGQHVKSAKR